MNGVHFNYTNAALHGAHYRKERGREMFFCFFLNSDWEIGVAEEGIKKKRKSIIRNEGRGMQKNEGM